jgi:hypothetical protein
MERLNLGHSLHSTRNKMLWRLRSLLRFSRDGYQETGAINLKPGPEELQLEMKYGLRKYRHLLSEATYRRNLWTLWVLEKALTPHLRHRQRIEQVLEPGCQDFSRLPALRSYLASVGKRPRITGLEIDPFPVLSDFHSRWDRARYFLSLETSGDRYLEGDFFQWNEGADLILCFFPFVSFYPALAWGLPAELGDARPWLASVERCLQPGGLFLVMHQGEWEEEEFDKARECSRLSLVHRETLNCPFYPQPHPSCVSVYRLDPLQETTGTV